MNAQQIRQKYLDFFSQRGHAVIKRAPIVLKEDSSTLFTGSGMQSLMPYLLGQEHPLGNRLTNSQTCLRAQDTEDVGDNRHTTFFEMLGNWSLGDYFKKQQIEWMFEFLTKEVGLDPQKLYVTCFIGDEANGIPKDTEAAEAWQQVFKKAGIDAKIVDIGSQADGDKIGMQGGRIFYYDDGENWWSRNGGILKTPIGDPCGPDSEMFYDFGPEAHDASFGEPHPASDSGRFVEIGNQVFMQYRRLEDGSFEPLKNKNIDFGGGLERIAAAAINSPDVFKISLLWPIVEKIEKISGKKYDQNKPAMRVIADHLRSAVFMAVDGCTPSNKEQGYVMRRFIRRAMVKSFDLGAEDNFFEEVVPVIVDLYGDDYPEVKAARKQIISILSKEEKIFRQTLRKGLKQLNRLKSGGLNGDEIFKLYDTFGFPMELSLEQAAKQEILVAPDWRVDYDARLDEQRQRSQTASKGMFKGGLESQGDMTIRLHTSAHLMLEAMKQVLGPDVNQKGANITEERLRFDFNYPEKVSRQNLDLIEKIVNQAIADALPVSFAEMSLEQALASGAHGDFNDRYGNQVRVYTVGNEDNIFSREICGGPHVTNTNQIAAAGQSFKIIKEESSSAGVRRVKAVIK